MDFAERSTLPEWMDTERVDFPEFRACLRDLARVNRLTLARFPTLDFLRRLLLPYRRSSRTVHIVDVGSGYGDLLRDIDRWARRHDVKVRLTGIDLNPWSQRAAEEQTSERERIRFVTADAFEYQPEGRVDVIVSSLFTHHLPNGQVVRFLRWMEKTARLGWFINDLHRHWLPYELFSRWSRLAGYHRFVQHDGPVSIARAFTRSDWDALLELAELRDRAQVRWRFPFRLTVERSR